MLCLIPAEIRHTNPQAGINAKKGWWIITALPIILCLTWKAGEYFFKTTSCLSSQKSNSLGDVQEHHVLFYAPAVFESKAHILWWRFWSNSFHDKQLNSQLQFSEASSLDGEMLVGGCWRICGIKSPWVARWCSGCTLAACCVWCVFVLACAVSRNLMWSQGLGGRGDKGVGNSPQQWWICS